MAPIKIDIHDRVAFFLPAAALFAVVMRLVSKCSSLTSAASPSHSRFKAAHICRSPAAPLSSNVMMVLSELNGTRTVRPRRYVSTAAPYFCTSTSLSSACADPVAHLLAFSLCVLACATASSSV